MGLYALTHVIIVSTGSTGTDSDMLGLLMPRRDLNLWTLQPWSAIRPTELWWWWSHTILSHSQVHSQRSWHKNPYDNFIPWQEQPLPHQTAWCPTDGEWPRRGQEQGHCWCPPREWGLLSLCSLLFRTLDTSIYSRRDEYNRGTNEDKWWCWN